MPDASIIEIKAKTIILCEMEQYENELGFQLPYYI